MISTFQARIDAGLVDDPGECVHGWPAGSDCPHCENDDLKNDLLAICEQAVELEAAYSELKDAVRLMFQTSEAYRKYTGGPCDDAHYKLWRAYQKARKAVEELL